MSRNGIITGGSWCVDYNRLLDRWPDQDDVAEILETEIGGGGSGHNLAAGVKKLDPYFPVGTIALVGDDENGRYLQGEADRHGIDRTRMQVTGGAPTHFTEAYTAKPTGRRTHITCRGTASLLTPDHFDFSSVPHRILHLGLPGVHKLMDQPIAGEANGWVVVLKAALAEGLLTNLEVASISPERLRELVLPCLPHLDLLIVNDREINAIAGNAVTSDQATDIEACIAAARTVLGLGAMRLVAVHFPKGALAVTRDGTVLKRPSIQVPAAAIAGANGAGDAFTSGFLYAFHQGWAMADALSLAHASAAASLRQMSTTGGIEPSRDCLNLAGQWGWRDAMV